MSSPLLLAQSVDFTVLRDIAFSFAVASSSSVVGIAKRTGMGGACSSCLLELCRLALWN